MNALSIKPWESGKRIKGLYYLTKGIRSPTCWNHHTNIMKEICSHLTMCSVLCNLQYVSPNGAHLLAPQSDLCQCEKNANTHQRHYVQPRLDLRSAQLKL